MSEHRPYLKVPYAPKIPGASARIATIEEVQAALPAGVDGLAVDNDLGYPSVTFPERTSYATMKRVVDHLENSGFTVD